MHVVKINTNFNRITEKNISSNLNLVLVFKQHLVHDFKVKITIIYVHIMYLHNKRCKKVSLISRVFFGKSSLAPFNSTVLQLLVLVSSETH